MSLVMIGVITLAGSFVLTLVGLGMSNRGFALRPKMYSNGYELPKGKMLEQEYVDSQLKVPNAMPINTESDLLVAAINDAFHSGKTVAVNRNEDGTVDVVRDETQE